MPRITDCSTYAMISLMYIAKIFQAYSRSPLYKGDDGLTITQLISRCREVGGEPTNYSPTEPPSSPPTSTCKRLLPLPQLNLKFIDTEFLPDSTSIYEPESRYIDPDMPITWRSAK